jgi:hypothetical protein
LFGAPGNASSIHPCLYHLGSISYEPTIGVTRKGGVFYFPAFSAFSNVAEDSVMRSADQGATWQQIKPSLAGQNTHRINFDPYLYVDPVTSRVFLDDLANVACSALSWSDDEGASWTHAAAGCMETDHQTLFAGPPRTSTTVGYPNVVYRCAINAVALAGASTMSTCQRSLTGGGSWLPPGQPAFVSQARAPPCDGALGHGFVDAKGVVYLPKGYCGQPWLAMSKDEGLTWQRVQVANNGMSKQGSAESGAESHEAGVGVDALGNVYYDWIATDRLPYLAVSRDGGSTWSPPISMAPPGVNEASLPALIAGGVGKIASVFMGSSNSPGAPFSGDYAHTTWDGYITLSFNALDRQPTFEAVSVNPASDPLGRGTCLSIRCGNVGDFLDVRISPDGSAWAAFVDTCTKTCKDEGATKNDEQEGAVGRAWGGPSLWDASDPNGPYPT